MYVQGVPGLGNPIGLAYLTPDTLYAVDTESNSLFSISVPLSASAPAPLLAAVLPGGRSVQLGVPATVFATVLNTGAANLADCNVSLGSTAPDGLSLSYQTTDATTNQLIGSPNQPAAIAANSAGVKWISLNEAIR